MIESLDDDDRDDRKEEPIMKKKKEYSNCFHATHSGMRCLNMEKNSLKIGPECYDFCKEHFDSTLLKLFTILTNPIEVPQEQIMGTQNIVFDNRRSIQCLTLDNDELLCEFGIDRLGELLLSIPYVWEDHPQSSVSKLVTNIMPYLEQRSGFLIKWYGVSSSKIDAGSLEGKIYGRFEGTLVDVPVDDFEMEILADYHGYLAFDVEIRYI
jgi:hypothetical protein